MKKYYILRSDGSSLFDKAYPLDFIIHCYYHLISCSDEAYSVIESFEACTVFHSLYFSNLKTYLSLTERTEVFTNEVRSFQGCSKQ